MRAIWKGTISFGLVNIPIALGIAAQRSDPSFRTLDEKTKQPIKQQLFSPGRGEVISREETVKGYEFAKGQYVVITDEELESVSVEKRRTIDILGFVEADEIDPTYYDRTYYLEPQEHAQKPYALLLRAMQESGKAALGRMVLSSKEHVVLMRPSGDALVIELLYYPEDVRSKEEIEEVVRAAKVSKQELEMAVQLVESLSKPFEPEEFENEHKRDVLDLVDRKLAGEEIEVGVEPPAPAPVPDLMEALKASLASTKKAGAEKPSKPARKPKAGGGGAKLRAVEGGKQPAKRRSSATGKPAKAGGRAAS